MKTITFISVLFLWALISICVVAIEAFKDEKQTGAFETFKTKVVLNEDGGLGGGGHNGDQGNGYNGDLEYSIESGGWKGSIHYNRPIKRRAKNNGQGGQGGVGT
ncbi:uncharacterized protein LOC131617680 isoform X2 [Vicia villosa]|uniref:uncharacterized protein LOC131617680 isoform X2 n=1 Tax=Vicia villosa TaxID=3911 RepID=UPI00273BE681|nr:uncharacterized protein LOC131617680 isoform X2 [Vicia villosa]